jgi:hypothetical protein
MDLASNSTGRSGGISYGRDDALFFSLPILLPNFFVGVKVTKFIFKVYQKYGPELYHISSCESETLQQAREYMESHDNKGIEFIKGITPEGIEILPTKPNHLYIVR